MRATGGGPAPPDDLKTWEILIAGTLSKSSVEGGVEGGVDTLECAIATPVQVSDPIETSSSCFELMGKESISMMEGASASIPSFTLSESSSSTTPRPVKRKKHQSSGLNVALNKPAQQRNQWKRGDNISDASNGVDGFKSDLSMEGGQCVISANNQQWSYWWVNLTSIHSIHHITIYYRTDNIEWGLANGYTSRFLGFEVYVSNTTDRLQGTLCFKDNTFTRATVPAVLTITCPVHGQYVIYYNERLPGVAYPTDYSTYAHNEICEVEVYECPTSEPECPVTCPDVNCLYCHNDTGNCTGCKPGFQGHQCQNNCTDGLFGDMCQNKCGQCSNLSQCHHIDGTCLGGCQPGYISEFCNQSCTGDTYGDNCSLRCGYCHDMEQCHHVNGTCMNGCEIGYQGFNCKTECNNGMYGDLCQNECGHCAETPQCHHINGTCLNGCLPGYTSEFCNQTCDEGLYGKNCSIPCGNCLALEQCHHINGTCMNGCDSGFEGLNCTEECEENYFGPNCKERCSDACMKCNKTTGVCDSGCYPGWKGKFCLEACSVGFFGQDCVEKCNDTCKGCNSFDGLCDKGCISGWKGRYCEQQCADNTFGPECTNKCGHCLNSLQCHHINGSCLEGCSSGYKGDDCQEDCDYGYYGMECREECSTFCKKSRDCHPISGYCTDGCKSGWQGLDCLEVSKLTFTENKSTSEFNGILSAFCLSLSLNGVLIVYFVVKRFRKSKVKQPETQQSNVSQKERRVISNGYINENNTSEYQELGELNKTDTYDSLQDVTCYQ